MAIGRTRYCSVNDSWKFIKAGGYNGLRGLTRAFLKSNNKFLVCYGTANGGSHHPSWCPILEEFGWSLTKTAATRPGAV